jgi:hypothetical protein
MTIGFAYDPREDGRIEHSRRHSSVKSVSKKYL